MIRKIICLMLLVPAWAGAAIVNNSTSSLTAEDSLAVVFYSLDSLGNAATADSVYLLVVGPSGDIVYRDSTAISDGRITSTVIRGKQFYTLAEQVSNLDGSGDDGVYQVTILTKRNSDGLLTPTSSSFQIISTELSDQISQIDDSVWVRGGAVDSNRTERGDGVDSTDVANWVWNAPQSDHTTGGTFGDYLDTDVSGIGAGTGAYAVTIVVRDTAAQLSVPSVGLAVRSLSQSSVLASGATGSEGRVAFNLDADSFIVVASAPGYIFSTFDTIVITGPSDDTIRGYQFDPGSPAVPGLCRVWSYLISADGTAEIGATISASLPGGIVRYNGVIISPAAVVTTTDDNGYFQLDLIPSELLNPSGTKYEITIARSDGTIMRRRLQIPDVGLWQLSW